MSQPFHYQADVELLGNLVTKELVLRYFADGEAMIQFDIVTKHKRPNQEEQLNYFSVTARGSNAESLSRAKAGQGIHLKGHLQGLKNKQGVMVSKVHADKLHCLNSKSYLSWNRISLLGRIVAISSLGKSVNNQSSIRVQVATNDHSENAVIECQFWGFPAELLANKGKVDQQILLDGELKQYKPSSGSAAKLNIIGHTCQVFNLNEDAASI